MSYEQENNILLQKLSSIDDELVKVEEIIRELPYFSSDPLISYHRDNAERRLIVLKEMRKGIEETLKESPNKRKLLGYLGAVVDVLPEAPKQVSRGSTFTKPVYAFSNGCLLWMIVFVVMGLIFIMLASS